MTVTTLDRCAECGEPIIPDEFAPLGWTHADSAHNDGAHNPHPTDTTLAPLGLDVGVVEDIDAMLAALPLATLMPVSDVADLLLDLRRKAEAN